MMPKLISRRNATICLAVAFLVLIAALFAESKHWSVAPIFYFVALFFAGFGIAFFAATSDEPRKEKKDGR